MSHIVVQFFSDQWKRTGLEIKDIPAGGKLVRRLVSLYSKDAYVSDDLKRVVRSTCLLGIVQIPLSLKRTYKAGVKFIESPNLQLLYRCIAKVVGLFHKTMQIIRGLKAVNLLCDSFWSWAKPIYFYSKIAFAVVNIFTTAQKIQSFLKEKSGNANEGDTNNKSTEDRSKLRHYWVVVFKASGRIIKHVFKMPSLGEAISTGATAVCLYNRCVGEAPSHKG